MTDNEKRPIAVLLDFDGVLVDSMPIHLRAWEEAYFEMFQSKLQSSEVNQLIGRSSAYIANYLCTKQHSSWRAPALVEKKAKKVQNYFGEVPLLPGAREFCEKLHELAIPFGIVSNAARAFIEGILQSCRLDVPFFFGIEDYTRPKPHPDPYLMGARQLQIQFSEYYRILTFEDSTHGLKAARQAFTTAIGIASQHEPKILLEAGAVKTFSNLAEALTAGILEWPLTRPGT